LRDIGGLIVIDFIDMESQANQRAVEDMLRDAVKMDRARIQLGRLSRFGLLELSRQRLRPALSETTHINCPRCGGMGTIRGVESMSLALLRLIGEEARKERTGRVIAQVPVDVATYLMNEKRDWLNQIESRDKVSLVIVPNPHLQTPAYTLRRIRDDEKELPENSTVSYQLADQPTLDDSNIGNRDKKPQGDVPLVPSILPASAAPITPMPIPTPVPAPVAAPQAGALVRFWRWLFGSGPAVADTAAPSSSTNAQRTRPAHRDARHDRYRSGGDRDRNRDRGERGDRDRNRDVRRDGPRDPRREGRPRGENRADSGPRRPEGGPQPDRAPRTDFAPRPEQPQRGDQPPRNEPPNRGGEPRTAEGAAGGERPNNDRGERGGRSRRRRGRGRREGGEGAVNGGAGATPGTNQGTGQGAGAGPGPAPDAPPNTAEGREDGPVAAFEAPREPAPPARAPDAPAASSTGTDNKYVVWSSAPSEVPRIGPDDR
jgi:ribonuclease E